MIDSEKYCERMMKRKGDPNLKDYEIDYFIAFLVEIIFNETIPFA